MEKTEVLSEKEQRKILFRLLTYTKPHKKSIFWAFSFLLLSTLADIAGPYLVKIFIDDHLTPKKMDFQPLLILGSAYMGIQIFKVIVLYFQLIKFQEIALYIIQQLRVDVFSKVQSLGLKYFDKT
ncbi:MAG: ABC transporter transmembrane domain-containing protein, partial [Bacillota bacterium]|nr:ABC transporter transmembrane domain-containing protein [Bacillota bacterium]